MLIARCNIFFFTLFLPIIAAAQYRFDSWTTDKGLPQNSVYSITQTPDGYMWFPTLDGLVRFDGVKFKVYNKSNSDNLTTNRLRNIFVQEDGTLWISTENAGLARFQNNQFRTFTTADGLPTNNILNVQKNPPGGLLIITSDGISRTTDNGASFTNGRHRDFREFKTYVGPSRVIWEISNDGLFASRSDGQMERFRLPFEPKPAQFDETFDFNTMMSLYEDKTGALWFGAEGKLFRMQNGEFTAFTSRNHVPPCRRPL